MEILERTLKDDPKNFHLNHRLALALDQLGQHDRAVACFEKALEVRPDDPKVHRALGFTLEQMGRHVDSVAQFKKAAYLEEL
ncbi:MAG: tetratricopeptide repeat protein [Magnetococcales bacterium]|nr:tetratricopeptide repeat protein [Magnetococcales bacterium]